MIVEIKAHFNHQIGCFLCCHINMVETSLAGWHQVLGKQCVPVFFTLLVGFAHARAIYAPFSFAYVYLR